MSKIKLSSLLKEYIGGGRIGTLNISFKDLQDKMDELEQSGKVIVREIPGPSGDGKVNREFEVVDRDSAVAGGNKQERGFTVYDYKFGFDPGSQAEFMNEYPFSVGGNDLRLAMELIDGVEPYGINEEEELTKSEKSKLKKVSSQLKKSVKAHDKQSKTIDSIISEADTSKLTDDEKKELKFHLDQFKKGNIDREDIMNVLDQFGLTEENVIKDLAQADEVIKIIKMMNPDVRQDLLKRIARMGQKLSENGHVDDYADEIEEGHAMSDNEADLESGVKGNMDAFTEEFIGESTQEESVAKYIIDYYRNPNKPEESMVTDEMVGEYFRTHKDWDQEGRWDGSKEGMEDGMKDFDEFFDANYGYMFPSVGEIDEDLKKHFKRFM